jgi:hypothetical protein
MQVGSSIPNAKCNKEDNIDDVEQQDTRCKV